MDSYRTGAELTLQTLVLGHYTRVRLRLPYPGAAFLPGGVEAGGGRGRRAGAILARAADENPSQRPPGRAVRGGMEVFPGAASERRKPVAYVRVSDGSTSLQAW